MIDDGLLSGLRTRIRELIAIGEPDGFDRIVEWAMDHVGAPAQSRTTAEQMVHDEFAAHAAAQATWPAVTDNDRLDTAFRELDEAGIVARQCFTCCNSCGNLEIGDEVPDGATARGFTFYHLQDAERALSGDGLYLAHGYFEGDIAAPGPADPVAIGREIAATLRRHGLTVLWNGDVKTKIHVPFGWQRRQVSAHP